MDSQRVSGDPAASPKNHGLDIGIRGVGSRGSWDSKDNHRGAEKGGRQDVGSPRGAKSSTEKKDGVKRTIESFLGHCIGHCLICRNPIALSTPGFSDRVPKILRDLETELCCLPMVITIDEHKYAISNDLTMRLNKATDVY